MHNFIRIFLNFCIIMSLSGCATMTIEGDGRKTPESKTGTHTSHGSYYGFVWSEPPATKCENGRGLYRVRNHTNAVYSLVSILSFGFYVPQTAEWWCDGTPDPINDGELYEKPALDN